MSGITKTGFERKTFQSIEDNVQSVFEKALGASVNTDPETANGQFKALMSSSIDDLWHLFEAVWQSRDINNLEGAALDDAAYVLRNIMRTEGETDAAFLNRFNSVHFGGNLYSRAINALSGVDGVKRVKILHNNMSETDSRGIPRNSWAIVVLGGDDATVAKEILNWDAGGTGLFGNTSIQITDADGFCRNVSFIRPIEVKIKADINISLVPSECSGCDALDTEGLFAAMAKSACSSSRDGEAIDFGFGSDVYIGDISSLLPPTSGVSVRGVKIAKVGDDFGVAPIELSIFEYATLSLSDVTVGYS